jgi:4-amino-4-deoxy-L-arabinose transferase-like glycosyltransferase
MTIPARISPVTAMVVLIAVSTLLRIVAGGSVGLGIGESYYYAAARHLSPSYFDQPPLAAFLAGLSLRLFGVASGLVLRAPFIALFAGSTWIMFLVGRRMFGPWQGFWAAVLLNLTPVFGLSVGVFFQPEGPLMFFWLATLYCVAPLMLAPASVRDPQRQWMVAGLMLGLAMLSKYSALFLAVGTGIYMLGRRDLRRSLPQPAPLIAAAVAALCLVPVVIWNGQHAWVSFLWQGSRGTAYRGFHIDWLVHNLSGQAIELTPWLLLALIIEPFRALGSNAPDRDARRLLACIALPPILAFTAVSSYADVGNHFHWGTPGYLTLLVGLGATVHGWFSRGRMARRLVIGAFATASLAYMVVVNVQAVTGGFTTGFGGLSRWLASGNDATIELIDYDALATKLRERGLLDRHDVFVFSDRWYVAGKVDYGLKGRLPMLVFNSDPREYAFFDSPDRWVGEEGILVSRRGDIAEIGAEFASYCSTLEAQDTVPIIRSGRTELSIYTYRCASLVRAYSLPYR